MTAQDLLCLPPAERNRYRHALTERKLLVGMGIDLAHAGIGWLHTYVQVGSVRVHIQQLEAGGIKLQQPQRGVGGWRCGGLAYMSGCRIGG